MNVGDELVSRVISIAYGGEGIIKHNGLTGFVHGVLPCELVKSRVTEIKRSYFHSKAIDILEPSPSRVIPPCHYFNHCGGCVYQHLIYEKQLETKIFQLQELFLHIGKIPDIKISSISPSPKVFNYRNHITLKIKSGNLGFIGIDNETFVPIERCLIAKEEINAKIQEIKNELRKGNSIKKVEGEIVIKCGADGATDHAFTESISPKGEYKSLKEKINDKIYYFSLAAFFQTNPYILPAILKHLKDALNLSPDIILFDLYSGTGLFSTYLSSFIKNAYGIETNPNAVKLAKKTLEVNNIKNCRFYEGEVEDVFLAVYEKNKGNKNIIILDPPRQGLNRKVLDFLKDIPPYKLVYVSCEPAKLARDLNFLLQNKYAIEDLFIADMFPHTKYIETLVILIHAI